MVDDLQRLGFLVEVAEDRIAVEEDRAVDARSERALSAEADFAIGRVDAEVGVAVEQTVLGVVEGAVVEAEARLQIEDDFVSAAEILGADEAHAGALGNARVHGHGRVAAVGLDVVQAGVDDAVDVNGGGAGRHGGERRCGHGRSGKQTKHHDESPLLVSCHFQP